jgi:hypothetical protein
MDNAVKYLRAGVPGSIEVRATESDGAITYEVRDNGRGIDARDRERIFDLFRRSGIQDRPGDGIGLRQADSTPKIALECLAVARKFVAPGPGRGANPIPASESPEYPEDTTDNARSTVLLLRFGNFEFLDAADLTGRLELRLVCPVNLVGEVDVFQVNHHGLDRSNNPVLIRSSRPTVTVMNNGDRKGCGPKTRAALKAVPSIQANYQLHKNLAADADNTPDQFIANPGPADACQANHVELHVTPDGSAYTVCIPATGHAQTFKTKLGDGP